jgi:hypothetical protein
LLELGGCRWPQGEAGAAGVFVDGEAGAAGVAGVAGVAGSLGAGVDGDGEAADGALSDGLAPGAGVAEVDGLAGAVAAGGLAGVLPGFVDGPGRPANTK